MLALMALVHRSSSTVVLFTALQMTRQAELRSIASHWPPHVALYLIMFSLSCRRAFAKSAFSAGLATFGGVAAANAGWLSGPQDRLPEELNEEGPGVIQVHQCVY
jgi:hypothetical protein